MIEINKIYTYNELINLAGYSDIVQVNYNRYSDSLLNKNIQFKVLGKYNNLSKLSSGTTFFSESVLCNSVILVQRIN